MNDWSKIFKCQDCYDTGYIPDSYSLKNMEGTKCTNKIHDMETTNSTVPAVILKAEEISKKFEDYKETAAKYDKYALALVIENADKLAVASNNVAQINNALKNIESIRKSYGQPYFDAVKAINAYAGVLSAPLEKLKTTINGKITTYKVLQEAQAKQKREKEAAELAKIATDKKAELDRLTQIQDMVKAMLYGGEYTNMKGVLRSSQGCKTMQECEELRKLVTDKFPAPASMKYCNKDATVMFETIIGWIDEHSSTLEVLNHIDDSKPKEALLQSAMQAGSVNASAMAQEILATATAEISKDVSKGEKKLDKEVANAKKGIRRTLSFNIIDEKIVPVQFKVVSDQLINAYLAEHKEELFQKLQDNMSIDELPGINVFVHDQNISK